MGENTKIEWCDHSWNFWTGCEPVSPACAHCYAASWAKRAGRVFAERRLTTESNRRLPMKWQCEAKAFADQHGRRQRVFVNSLADWADNQVPDEWRISLFEAIATAPDVDFLLLTKRIGNAARMLPVMDSTKPGYRPWNRKWPWPNVWIGATVANQEEANRDLPKLLRIAARVRFLSCEPQLGPIDLREAHFNRERLPRVDWVIVGGESGSKARPFVLGHAKDIVRQCREAGVAVFMKQAGSNPVNREGERCPHIKSRKGDDPAEWPEELRVREFPRGAA